MTIEEELALVEAAKTNIQAFEKLYSYYFDRIYGYCLKRTGNVDISKDVTSHTFMQAVEHIGKFKTEKGIRFGAWLYRTAHNRIIDQGKRKSSKNEDLSDHEIGTEYNLDKEITLITVQGQIVDCMSNLNSRYQQIISLRFYSELEIPEIAAVMELKPKSVSVILHRALEKLKKEFRKKYPETEIFDLI